mgnify:CR=1 FL=1
MWKKPNVDPLEKDKDEVIHKEKEQARSYLDLKDSVVYQYQFNMFVACLILTLFEVEY